MVARRLVYDQLIIILSFTRILWFVAFIAAIIQGFPFSFLLASLLAALSIYPLAILCHALARPADKPLLELIQEDFLELSS